MKAGKKMKVEVKVNNYLQRAVDFLCNEEDSGGIANTDLNEILIAIMIQLEELAAPKKGKK